MLKHSIDFNKKDFVFVLEKLKRLFWSEKRGDYLIYKIESFYNSDKKGNALKKLKEINVIDYLKKVGFLEITDRDRDQDAEITKIKLIRTDFDTLEKEFDLLLADTKEPMNKIEKITIIPTGSRDMEIIINNDNDTEIIVDKEKGCWKILFRVASKEEVPYENKMKNPLRFINSEKKCRLYSKTGYSPTKILKVVNNYVRPAIKLDKKTSLASSRRKKEIKRD